MLNLHSTMNTNIVAPDDISGKNGVQQKCVIQLFQFFYLPLCMMWCIGLAAILYDYHSHAPQFAWTGKSMELGEDQNQPLVPTLRSGTRG